MPVASAVVPDYAVVDQAGKISVLGMFQHIWVQQFPATHPRLHLVLRLKGKRTEVGEHHVQIRLLDEQDAEILGEGDVAVAAEDFRRSEEHTSELQSRSDLVCRLLLEKKKKHNTKSHILKHQRSITRAQPHMTT